MSTPPDASSPTVTEPAATATERAPAAVRPARRPGPRVRTPPEEGDDAYLEAVQLTPRQAPPEPEPRPPAPPPEEVAGPAPADPAPEPPPEPTPLLLRAMRHLDARRRDLAAKRARVAACVRETWRHWRAGRGRSAEGPPCASSRQVRVVLVVLSLDIALLVAAIARLLLTG